MNEQTLFIKANQTLQDVVGQIRAGQMEQVVPEEMSWRPGWTLRRIVNVYAYENKCVPDVLAGKEMRKSNDQLEDDLLGNDPQANYNKYHEIAQQSVKELDENGLNCTVHISYGDVPARGYLRDITINRGLGAYDTARFIGADTALPDDLVQGLWDSIVPIAGDLRQFGIFGPKVEVPEDAPLQDRLLGLTGRQPRQRS